MPPRIETCPHCGNHVENDEEFCAACGAWLYGGPDWPAPPQPMPIPEIRTFNPDAEPVPLQLPTPVSRGGAPMATRRVIALVAVASAIAWAFTELKVVAQDNGMIWDVIWVVAATVTVLLGVWLLVDAIRRGRNQGWDRAWRFWESP